MQCVPAVKDNSDRVSKKRDANGKRKGDAAASASAGQDERDLVRTRLKAAYAAAQADLLLAAEAVAKAAAEGDPEAEAQVMLGRAPFDHRARATSAGPCTSTLAATTSIDVAELPCCNQSRGDATDHACVTTKSRSWLEGKHPEAVQVCSTLAHLV
jgi:hypothetical protein